jgi:hypothetical protein
MNRHKITRLSALTALGLALLTGSAVSQQKSLKDQLVGTWTVASWDQTNKDGSKLQRFGANPKGVNVFNADGRFFVMFAHPDLPKIASNNPMTPTPDEAKALVQGTISYFGTYTVDEAKKRSPCRSTPVRTQISLASLRSESSARSQRMN